jgi:hypothetical protein
MTAFPLMTDAMAARSPSSANVKPCLQIDRIRWCFLRFPRIVSSISQCLRLRYEEPLTVYFDDHAIFRLGYANCMTL